MLIWICFLTYALCFVLVPSVSRLAWRIGAVDVPRDWRRMHRKSIPRAGGLAIYASFFVGCIVWGRGERFLAATLGGGLLMLLSGLTDDIFSLGAWTKLFFQIACAIAAVLGCGAATDGRDAFFAVLWVLTLTNAHNFIDGLDGLFCGCAAIEGGALCLCFALFGRAELAIPPLLLSLSCLAFRHYNRHPARIFAGDCGSGTVGFLFGMMTLPLFGFLPSGLPQLSPLFLFAYPLTDLLTAVLRRVLRGKSPFAADRGHLHHRLSAAGLPQPFCVRVLLLISATLGGIGVLLSAERFFLFAALFCLLAVLLMMRVRRFIIHFA